MIKVCEGPGCGMEFTARSPRARFHNDACRKRAARHPEPVAAGRRPRPRWRPGIAEAARRELAVAGVAGTAQGAAAVILAECLDAGWWDEPLAGVARLSRELGAAMDRALAEAGRDDAPLPRNVVPIDRGRA